MRIVAGVHRGRHISAPKGRGTRPTADRVREAVFNVLLHGLAVDLEGATTLDLFAGSGALGLEALSRGAAQAVFVETDREALDLIRDNLTALGEGERSLVLRRDAARLGPRPADVAPAALAFLDPPYGQELAAPALAAAASGGWLAERAICVIETGVREPFTLPDGFITADDRAYGKSRVRFLIASL